MDGKIHNEFHRKEHRLINIISFCLYSLCCTFLYDYSNALTTISVNSSASFVIIRLRTQHYISIRLKNINAKKNLPKLLSTVIIQSKISVWKNQLNWSKKNWGKFSSQYSSYLGIFSFCYLFPFKFQMCSYFCLCLFSIYLLKKLWSIMTKVWWNVIIVLKLQSLCKYSYVFSNCILVFLH